MQFFGIFKNVYLLYVIKRNPRNKKKSFVEQLKAVHRMSFGKFILKIEPSTVKKIHMVIFAFEARLIFFYL